MSDFSVLSGSDFDNSGMTGARDAVDILHIGLGDDHLVVEHDLSNIVMGSGLYDVLDLKSLDALVLRNGSSTVAANDYA